MTTANIATVVGGREARSAPNDVEIARTSASGDSYGTMRV